MTAKKPKLVVKIVYSSSSPSIKLCGACNGKGQQNITSNKVPWTGKESDRHFIVGTQNCDLCEGTGRIVEITKHSITHQAYRPKPLKPVKKKPTRKKK